MKVELASEDVLVRVAGGLARIWRDRDLGAWLVGLRGPLGSGKTTWVRAMLRGLGYAGRVPSPTYTLLEEYRVGALASLAQAIIQPLVVVFLAVVLFLYGSAAMPMGYVLVLLVYLFRLMTEALSLQAGALPNPELRAEVENVGGSGSRQGFEETETTLGIAQLVELGGKRAARVRMAESERGLAVKGSTLIGRSCPISGGRRVLDVAPDPDRSRMTGAVRARALAAEGP